ncbi:MAG: MBOAT family protein [Methylococcaceae bacterium]|nr:MBOAT family protein [Methylococcaceae bacterium]
MLFNSYAFIFVFLPVTVIGFYYLGRERQTLAGFWLLLCSLFFYGWWNPPYVILLLASMIFNFMCAKAMTRKQLKLNKPLLIFGVGANLVLLGYYKYAHFLMQTMQAWVEFDDQFSSIILPLGISFFTFTQIAFLVDTYRGEVKKFNFIHYGLFVTYFPHLIAGPILHHQEMMPQFAKPQSFRLKWQNLSVGLTLFALGLFKKVVLADGVATFANPLFSAALHGEALTFLGAWGGALAYSLQLYFDFSGYSDMAIGLSCLFGIKLPCNFNSPYQAVNIIEFWRRWHITLSRFLRDYLYIPLGGSRNGTIRRYLNLLITMLLGGLWHGAGWTFIVWGGLHGIFLLINHAWQKFRCLLGQDLTRSSLMGRWAARSLTFLVVVVAWVFFRAENLDVAFSILDAMSGFQGIVLPNNWQNGLPLNYINILQKMGITFIGVPDYSQAGLIIGLWGVVWFTPNTQQILRNYSPTLDRPALISRLNWQPSISNMVVVAVILLYALTEIGTVSDFLYFQF